MSCETLFNRKRGFISERNVENMAGKSISKILKSFHLRAVKDIKFSFDPYKENVRSIREILFMLHSPKIIETNQNLNMKIDIKSDRSDPLMNVTFGDGYKMTFKTANLSTVEMMERLNVLCLEKDPKKNIGPVATTKSAKKRK